MAKSKARLISALLPAAVSFGAEYAALLGANALVGQPQRAEFLAAAIALAAAVLWSAPIIFARRALAKRFCVGSAWRAVFTAAAAVGEFAAPVVYAVVIVRPICAEKTGVATLGNIYYLLVLAGYTLGFICFGLSIALTAFCENKNDSAALHTMGGKNERDN